MVYNNFRARLLLKIGKLVLTISLLAFILFYPHWYVSAFCLALLIAAQIYFLIEYVEQTNRELTRFFSAIRYSDFTQRFSPEGKNPTFKLLYHEFNEVIEAFQRIKAEKEANHLYLQTIVEHMSIGVMTFNADGEVKLFNKAAKELLRLPYLKNIKSLERISLELMATLHSLETGDSKLVSISREDGAASLVLRATQLQLQGEQLKIISLQNIRSEMEEQELEAWQKLIRVLSHEIMNSITPVVSLASSIHDLVAQDLITQTAGGHLAVDEEVMADVQTGLLTIEKRSEGLLHFVHDYRKLARVPKPNLKPVKVKSLFEQLDSLMRTEMGYHQVKFALHVPKEDMEIAADAELISQVLINLVKNAMEACSGCENPQVEIFAYYDAMENNRVRIDVKDNGPGIPEEIIDKIFIPFYTTKKEGSGIGLSLSRQIMRLHRGTLRVNSTAGKQTIFSLLF
ncbi:sensor histidine kinase [Adhaeribacter pallidiroseus]|uniref:histidine kinase n=1 Tax=Adhaeribacter pallidiroseus TaxID=2072847 RepID=A0A369QBP1_9BACT|nr:ATP-binding protein [Adhaeribacter pallidiroseus]RDC62124.1 Histidine kinase [Adhaeribacter pallidiroseus]